MKLASAFILLSYFSNGYGDEDTGKICINIPERGVEIVKITNKCKKGDIIQLNKIHIASLCDFNSAIVPYDGPNQYVCSYLGRKREVREGTNYNDGY